MANEQSKPDRPRRRASLRIKLGVLGLSLGFVLAAMECGARLVTRTGEYGERFVARFRLLPNRPTEAEVAAIMDFASAPGGYQRFDLRTGWSLVPGGRGMGMQANPQGIRGDADRVYDKSPVDGRYRVLTVGDSFTHGDEVGNDQTWQHYLESGDERLEVLNLGVPGFGMDQAYIRWQEYADELDSDLVVLGVWPEDICRNLNVARFYLSRSVTASKPRFVLSNGALEAVNLPVATGDTLRDLFDRPGFSPLFEHERWWAPGDSDDRWWFASRAAQTLGTIVWMLDRKSVRNAMYKGEDPSAIELAVAISQQFDREVRTAGADFVVVLLPMRALVDDFGPDWEFPLGPALTEAGVSTMDLWPAMREAVGSGNLDELMPRGRHYTAKGNALVAEVLATKLEDRVATKLAGS